jgi:far upstream element-binding protein
MAPGSTNRSITLKGTPEQVAELKRRIDEIITLALAPKISQQRTNTRNMDSAFVIKLQIPNDKVGVIIGRQGSVLKGIQERTRASIQIPTNPDEDNPNMRTISIGAEIKDDADAAQMEIFMHLQQSGQAQLQQQMQAAAPTTAVCIAIPDDKVGLLIGKGGMTIRDLQQRCKVRLQLPQEHDPGSFPPTRTITIQGSAEGQMLARYEIETILGYQQGGGYQAAPAAQMYGGWGQQAAAPAYDMYGQYAQHAQQDTAAAVAPADPTAYYNDFWQYAAYYGEAAARLYYTAWSPPEGTPPPPGITLPSATGATTTESAAPSNVADAAQSAEAPTTVTAEEKEAWDKYYRELAEYQALHGDSATNGAAATENSAP